MAVRLHLGPPTRSLENVLARTDLTPVHLFQVLWPVWQVEVEADGMEPQNYDLLDRFVVRSVVEAGFTRIQDIAWFLSISPALVQGACRFLSRLGHLSVDGDEVSVTPLGRESLAVGKRLVHRTSRVFLLFDTVTAEPLPRDYHSGGLNYLTDPSLSGWHPLLVRKPFPPSLVDTLAGRPDRSSFNLPTHLHDPKIHGVRTVYTPAHLITTRQGDLLAFSEAAPDGDQMMNDAWRHDPELRRRIAQTPVDDPQMVWTEWISNKSVRATPAQRPDGVWRISIQGSAFTSQGSLQVSRIGGFEYRKHNFMQIWCAEEKLRRRTLLLRLSMMKRGGVIKTQDNLARRLGELCRLLELPRPENGELRSWAADAELSAEYEEVAGLANP